MANTNITIRIDEKLKDSIIFDIFAFFLFSFMFAFFIIASF